MKQFEYMKMHISSKVHTNNEIINIFNKIGKEGWELTTKLSIMPDVYIFKKEIFQEELMMDKSYSNIYGG